ncbi:hypothetical protein [Mumia sp. DW29H23]|uniref:hypothetical protein n=1 Tax=Mumia sp. DW29H23 TaxID=3421241 RepID=UPI003D694FFB
MGPLPMTRTLRRAVVGAAAAALGASALVVTATTAPAAAKPRAFTDEPGDVPAALDITKVKVANTKHAVVVRLTVPGLRRSQVGLVSVAVKARHRPVFVVTKARFDGRWHRVSLVRRDVGAVVRCRDDRVSFGERSITVRVPHRCLGGARRAVRVRAEVLSRASVSQLGDPAPATGVPSDTYPDSRTGLSPWVRRR